MPVLSPSPAAHVAQVAPRPPIVAGLIPFPAARKREMRRYARRHYGVADYHLRDPRVIVEHITATLALAPVIRMFASDAADPELHEKPGTCAHFVIDRDGTIHQLVSLALMCRHTVGLNDRSIGIEHVATADARVFARTRQFRASLALTRWLQARYAISTPNVIGHAESLSSPYHHERVTRLRTQTHGDMVAASMRRYRRAL